MAPPLPLRHYADPSVINSQMTEDTPPDLLLGSMKLKVTLPSGKQTNISVHRSTPMMDVLVQVTSAHKINPGNHAIRVVCNNRNIQYKPSTAVGSLDISAIEIVNKNKNNEEGSYKDSRLSKDKKVRLKEWVYKQKLLVNLPRNQLAVYRLPPKTLISEVLSMICEDKNLDEDRYEIRHPVNVDERLRGSCSLSDYQLQEVCIVSRNYRAPPLSVNDLFAMSSLSHHQEDRKRRGFRAFFSRKNKHAIGNCSLSSGSTGDRSDSPESEATKIQSSSRLSLNVNDGVKYRPNDDRIFRPSSLINLSKVQRKRPAPLPPKTAGLNGSYVNGSSATTSCHNLLTDDGGRTASPTSSEIEEENKVSSRSSSRNMNSPIGGPSIHSRMKRKAPLPPQSIDHSEEIVSSQDKDSSISVSPDLHVSVDSETRSTTPSEVSIDVRPSSTEVSDAIPEEENIVDSPLGLIPSGCNSPICNDDPVEEPNVISSVQKSVSADYLESKNVTFEDAHEAISTIQTVEEIENLIETTSTDEEVSSTKPIETLDEILDKAEAEFDKDDKYALSNYLTNEDLNDISYKSQSNDRDSLEQTTETNGNSYQSSKENASEFSIEETVDLKTVRESVAEAVNDLWNDEENVPSDLPKDSYEVPKDNYQLPKDGYQIPKDSYKSKAKYKENERIINEDSEHHTLLFNFVEKNRNKISKSDSINEEINETFITELSSSANTEESELIEPYSTSNYNVILKMTPTPRPRTEIGRKSPSSDSVCSFHSFKTESEIKSRSNTDASYESVPPPLPSHPIPERSEFDDDESVYSIVSSSSNDSDPETNSSNSVLKEVREKPKLFSISTYTNRDHKKSYAKRLTRSESLQEISHPLEMDKTEKRTSSLQRNQSVKSECFKNISINSNTEGSNSLERSHRFRNNSKDIIERRPKVIEENDTPSTATDPETVNRSIKPVVPHRVSKWYQEFNKDYIGPRISSNLRKTKSTADIRMNDGQPQASGTDPGLAQEYMKLQNDFMKWQNQLMQNQNVLHNKVAPIAAPNLVMGQNTQMPYNMEKEAPKRREINIPIRMEGENESNSSFSTTDSMKSTSGNGTVNSSGNQSQGQWNGPPNVRMGSLKDRPSNVECVVVTDPPQIFQAPDDPRFAPVYIKREVNPSSFSSSFLPSDPVFREPSFETMNSHFGGFPNRPQFASDNSQFAQPPTFNQGPPVNSFHAPPLNNLQTQQLNNFQSQPANKFQAPPINNFQAPPINNFQAPPLNSFQTPPANSFQARPSKETSVNNESVGSYMPSFTNSENKPIFNTSPIEKDNSNGKFTSVVTLSNEQDANKLPRKGKSPQFNNVTISANNVSSEPTFSSSNQTSWKNDSNNGINSSNFKNKSPSPEKSSFKPMSKDSFTPMSSRLVQAASSQSPTTELDSNHHYSHFDNKAIQNTPYNQATLCQYPALNDNSHKIPENTTFDTKRVTPPTTFESVVYPKPFDSRNSYKPQPFDSRASPKPQNIPPVPKFEPSRESEPEPIRISPPRRQKKSPIKQVSPPRNFQPVDRSLPHHIQSMDRSSPVRDKLSDSFANMLPPSAVPPQEQFGMQTSSVPSTPPGTDIPPPPPPPPQRMKQEIRRTSTGKKIFGSNQAAPELDAREELMMAIRKFGGSRNLRKENDMPQNYE